MDSDLQVPQFNCTKCAKFVSFAQLYEDDLDDVDYGLCRHNTEDFKTVSKYRTCDEFDPE